MINYTKNGWRCPKCQSWHRVRGRGRKIRRCSCGYKVIIESGYVEHTYLRSEIFNVEEIK